MEHRVFACVIRDSFIPRHSYTGELVCIISPVFTIQGLELLVCGILRPVLLVSYSFPINTLFCSGFCSPLYLSSSRHWQRAEEITVLLPFLGYLSLPESHITTLGPTQGSPSPLPPLLNCFIPEGFHIHDSSFCTTAWVS